MIGVYIFIFIVIIQRLWELIIAKRNEQAVKHIGGVEVGGEHYFLFILLHIMFFISLIIETTSNQTHLTTHFRVLLWGLFILTQLLRVWCIQSLGMYWNTKIIIVPEGERITKGPYKFIKHPNYVIVAIELIVIPLLVQAYFTAVLFPFLHILLLLIRIPAENKALRRLHICK